MSFNKTGRKHVPLRKDKANAIEEGLSEEQIKASLAVAEEALEGEDGIDRLMKKVGLGREHRTVFLGICIVVISVAVMMVFSNKSVGLESRPDTMTTLKAEEGRVAVLDSELLVKAAVGMALDGKDVGSPDELGRVIKEVIQEHEARGIVVVKSDAVISRSGYRDLTAVIAQRMNIDLEAAAFADRGFKPAPPLPGVETEDEILAGFEQ